MMRLRRLASSTARRAPNRGVVPAPWRRTAGLSAAREPGGTRPHSSLPAAADPKPTTAAPAEPPIDDLDAELFAAFQNDTERRDDNDADGKKTTSAEADDEAAAAAAHERRTVQFRQLRAARTASEVEGILEELGPLRHEREYSIAIAALGRVRRPLKALSLFDAMLAAGMSANAYTFGAAMGACERGGEWERALALLEEARNCEGGAAHLLAEDAYAFNSAMAACDRAHRPDRVFEVEAAMLAEGVAPNSYTRSVLLSACAQAGVVDKARQILTDMVRVHEEARAQSPSFSSQPARRAPAWSNQQPERFNGPDAGNYACGIAAGVKAEDWQAVIDLFYECRDARGLEPRSRSVAAVAHALEHLGHWDAVVEVLLTELQRPSPTASDGPARVPARTYHNAMLKATDVDATVTLWTTLLDKIAQNPTPILGEDPDDADDDEDAYCILPNPRFPSSRTSRRAMQATLHVVIKACATHGRPDLAHRAFDAAPTAMRSTRAYHAVIAACKVPTGERPVSESTLFHEALQYLEEARRDGLADVVVYNATLSVLERTGQHDAAWQLFETMKRRGVAPNDETFATVVTAAGRAHRLDRVFHVLDRESPAARKKTKTAVDADHDGQEDELVGDVILYNAAISACSRCGDVDAAMRVLARMRGKDHHAPQQQHGGDHHLSPVGRAPRPDVISYNAAIAACRKAGQWREALALMAEMEADVVPDDITFNTAIAACEEAGEVEHGVALWRASRERDLRPRPLWLDAYSMDLRDLPLPVARTALRAALDEIHNRREPLRRAARDDPENRRPHQNLGPTRLAPRNHCFHVVCGMGHYNQEFLKPALIDFFRDGSDDDDDDDVKSAAAADAASAAPAPASSSSAPPSTTTTPDSVARGGRLVRDFQTLEHPSNPGKIIIARRPHSPFDRRVNGPDTLPSVFSASTTRRSRAKWTPPPPSSESAAPPPPEQ